MWIKDADGNLSSLTRSAWITVDLCIGVVYLKDVEHKDIVLFGGKSLEAIAFRDRLASKLVEAGLLINMDVINMDVIKENIKNILDSAKERQEQFLQHESHGMSDKPTDDAFRGIFMALERAINEGDHADNCSSFDDNWDCDCWKAEAEKATSEAGNSALMSELVGEFVGEFASKPKPFTEKDAVFYEMLEALRLAHTWGNHNPACSCLIHDDLRDRDCDCWKLKVDAVIEKVRHR